MNEQHETPGITAEDLRAVFETMNEILDEADRAEQASRRDRNLSFPPRQEER